MTLFMFRFVNYIISLDKMNYFYLGNGDDQLFNHHHQHHVLSLIIDHNNVPTLEIFLPWGVLWGGRGHGYLNTFPHFIGGSIEHGTNNNKLGNHIL